MEKEIRDLGICELHSLYREKKLSPAEVAADLLKEIRENDSFNAFASVLEESALIAAKESEKRYLAGNDLGVMDGIPFGVKDIFYSAGHPTTMASRIFRDFIPDHDAAVISLLKQNGAILLGKTNTHEFACSPTADVSIFGPMKNPRCPEMMACGSSGGSGAALAAHLLPAALGSDTGGSVRIPAAACGVVGMRPNAGRVSRVGVFPLSGAIDNIGPMTRNIKDNAAMLNCMCTYDCRDRNSISLPAEDFGKDIGKSVKGLSIGIPADIFKEPMDDEIRAATENVIRLLSSLGAEIKHIGALDSTGEYSAACRTMRICDAYYSHKEILASHSSEYTEEIRAQLMSGEPYKADEYIAAMEKQHEFRLYFREISKDADLVLIPTLPILPPPIGLRQMEIGGKEYGVANLLTSLTVPASFTGFPALSVPGAFCSGNRPTGVQLMGRGFDESLLYRVGYAIEQELCLNI